MKKLLLFILTTFLGFSATAQTCTPDGTALSDTIIANPLPYQDAFPERGFQDTACVNSYFETVLNLRIPPSVDVGIGFPLTLEFASMEESDAIQNLPASFDYICNPPNCVFPADSLACIVIYGTADEGDIGVHDLVLALSLKPLFLPAQAFDLPDGDIVNGNYYFTVKAEGSENCTILDAVDDFVIENFAVHNQPNPFYSNTEIVINAKIGGTFDLSVQDMAGKVLSRSTINIVSGENVFTYDGSALAAGMYIFTISNGHKSIASKMLIGNR